MAITSLGIGSGLDLEGMLEKLMTVERQPLSTIAAKQESYNTKLSAYSMVQSTLSTFQSAVKELSSIGQYQKSTATSSNEDIAKITAGSSAATSTYSLKVSQLAASQRLVTTMDIASDKDIIGTGKITIDFGKITGTATDGKYGTGTTFDSNSAGVKTIEITDGNDSLAGIRDAINAAGVGVTASIVNVGGTNPYRLTLTNSATGEEQSMKISVDGDQKLKDLLSHDPASGTGQNLKETVSAQNAKFTLDGIDFSKASNNVSDAIEGVTINLLSADTSKSATLSVTRDSSAAKTAVEKLVKAYNDLNTTLKELTTYNAEEKTASVLTGDSAVRSIQTELKKVFSQPISGGATGYRMLADVGVTLNKEGVLEIDSSKLGTALEKNFDAFTAMFAEGGLSTNPSITFEDAEDYAKTGSFEVNVTQAATKGKYTFGLNAGLDLSATDDAKRTMQISLDGSTKSITLDKVKYATDAELASAIQSRINTAFKDSGSSVTVKAENGTFTIESAAWGSASKVSLSETGGLFKDKVETDGKDVEGTINGQAATGKGQTLTGASGTDGYGLKLKVTGDDPVKGTVSFTQGYAYQFTKVADYLLADKGVIKSRIEGVNASIKSAEKEYATYEERIAAREESYRRQFTALDVLIAKLNSQSSYLTTQLQSLSNLWNNSSKK